MNGPTDSREITADEWDIDSVVHVLRRLADLAPTLRSKVGKAFADAAPMLAQAADELERLHSICNAELTVRDLEVKIREGEVFLQAITGQETQYSMKLLAAIMLNFILGPDGEEPENYRMGEVSLSPAGEVGKYRCFVEVVKPWGKSSHEIRRELEARLPA